MTDNLIFKLKIFLKKHPRFFLFLYNVLVVATGKSAKSAIKHLPKGSVILNLGSGVKKIREDVINVDLQSHISVSVVADVYKLPFEDNSVDAVIAESLLEHLERPEEAVREMQRVLKPGGLLYIFVPFMLGFHSSPNDYCRWTTSGLRELLKDFEEKELGVGVGPTNALTYMIREWLSLVLSFNSSILYQLWTLVFMVIFAPFNALDFIFARYKMASNFAYAIYFIGTKKK